MADRHPCSHLIEGKCKSGWPVTMACAPWPIARGKWMPVQQPYCMNETIAARLFPEHGGPLLSKGNARG